MTDYYANNYLIAFANVLLVLLFSLLLFTETVVEEILLLNTSTTFLSQQFLYLTVVLFKLVYDTHTIVLSMFFNTVALWCIFCQTM